MKGCGLVQQFAQLMPLLQLMRAGRAPHGLEGVMLGGERGRDKG